MPNLEMMSPTRAALETAYAGYGALYCEDGFILNPGTYELYLDRALIVGKDYEIDVGVLVSDEPIAKTYLGEWMMVQLNGTASMHVQIYARSEVRVFCASFSSRSARNASMVAPIIGQLLDPNSQPVGEIDYGTTQTLTVNTVPVTLVRRLSKRRPLGSLSAVPLLDVMPGLLAQNVAAPNAVAATGPLRISGSVLMNGATAFPVLEILLSGPTFSHTIEARWYRCADTNFVIDVTVCIGVTALTITPRFSSMVLKRLRVDAYAAGALLPGGER